MFTTEERDIVRNRVLDLARADVRVTAGALTGSAAVGEEDQWSDVDVAFGIAEGVSVVALLDEWTRVLERDLGIIHYWDLPSGSSVYRVFLLPSGLEVDVGVTPQQDFGARGPRFQTLFGSPRQLGSSPEPSARYVVGLGWHHIFHARSSIERGKPWRAEYWISHVREQTLALASMRFGDVSAHARGVDLLPTSVTEPLTKALVGSLDTVELRRALGAATACFIKELEWVDPTLCGQLKPLLEESGAQHGGTAGA